MLPRISYWTGLCVAMGCLEAGCGPTGDVSPTLATTETPVIGTSTPTETPVAETPSLTPTEVPTEPSRTPDPATPKPPRTPEPTPEPTPSATPEPTPTFAPTPTPYLEPTPTLGPLDFELTPCDTPKTFWMWDTAQMPPRSVEVETRCVFTGPTSYLYVATDQWGVTVDESQARTLMITWEYRAGEGALDPMQGLFANDRLVFGEIPDALDNDPRMYVLLADIPDYVNDEGEVFSFDGYFNAYDQMTDEEAQRSTFGLYHSNEVEMLYLNSRIRPVNDPYTLAVAAHELQHLVAYNYDTGDEVWMSEALAEVAMLVNGYFTDRPWVARYLSNTSIPLVTSTASGSYGAYLLWGMYLYEQLGVDFMKVVESEQQDGIRGLNRALTSAGSERDFLALFTDWVVANWLKDPTLEDGRYGYWFSDDIPETVAEAELVGGDPMLGGELEAFAIHYVPLVDVSTNATLTVVSSDATNLLAELVTEEDGVPVVEVLRPDPQGIRSLRLEGGSRRTYALILANTNQAQIDSGISLGYEVTLE